MNRGYMYNYVYTRTTINLYKFCSQVHVYTCMVHMYMYTYSYYCTIIILSLYTKAQIHAYSKLPSSVKKCMYNTCTCTQPCIETADPVLTTLIAISNCHIPTTSVTCTCIHNCWIDVVAGFITATLSALSYYELTNSFVSSF